MSQLKTLLEQVRDQNLNKSELEHYHSEFTNLFSQIHLELAELEKAEAMYILGSELPTDIAKKRAWKGTLYGQRLIELNHFAKACEKQLSSIKNRIYSQL